MLVLCRNCLFEFMTDKIFSSDRPPSETPGPPNAPYGGGTGTDPVVITQVLL